MSYDCDVYAYKTADELINDNTSFDIAFLDIELDNNNTGFDIVHTLRLNNKKCIIVFLQTILNMPLKDMNIKLLGII